MAIFRIKPADSVFTTTNAFDMDSPGAPDTLIVDPGAFMISTGANGAYLAPTGAWTVSVNGAIVSQGGVGIWLDTGNAAVSTIKIGVDGEVQGAFGIQLLSSANLNNAGIIESTNGFAIQIQNAGTHVITNSGTITGGGGFSTILDLSGLSNDTVRNSGTINGDITLTGGNDTVTNSGLVTGPINLGHDTNRLGNSGQVLGNVTAGDGSDTVANAGSVGAISLGNGNNSLTNSGTIDGGVNCGDGADTVTNFAIVAGVMKSGTINATIFLGDGNDKFTGGANSEIVRDDDGADFVALGGGNDTYIAHGSSGADGIDIVGGGAGVDTYAVRLATTDCRINLDTVAHNATAIFPGDGFVAANTATGTTIAGSAKDTIFGFENVFGGNGNDLIYGTAAGNRFDGDAGNDFLFGFGGNDTLQGSFGDDDLIGGAGKDTLIGDSGVDRFHYTALSDSGITATTRDLIADFDSLDLIDLHLIDANKTNAAGTDDHFNFIGNNVPFTGAAGDLRAYWTAIGQMIEGDVNGDRVADFSIELRDPLHMILLSGDDFFI
jgi:hypothetical protein